MDQDRVEIGAAVDRVDCQVEARDERVFAGIADERIAPPPPKIWSLPSPPLIVWATLAADQRVVAFVAVQRAVAGDEIVAQAAVEREVGGMEECGTRLASSGETIVSLPLLPLKVNESPLPAMALAILTSYRRPVTATTAASGVMLTIVRNIAAIDRSTASAAPSAAP